MTDAAGGRQLQAQGRGNDDYANPEDYDDPELKTERWKRLRALSGSVLPVPPVPELPVPLQRDVLNMQNYVSNKMDLMKRTQSSLRRTTQLAAFVPDFILYDEGQKIPYQTTMDGVALIADVSGFTALTEKYSMKGNGGTDQLTKTLSSYMGPLAECILRAGGDIIKYAGDAILAFWRVSDRNHYNAEIQRVIDCSLYIQEKYGSYETDVGITIRVKLGIGAGRCFQCGVGNQDYCHFVCFGPGVKSASEAEHHCESGEVIVQLAAWELCNPAHFSFTVKEEGFMKIHDIHVFVNPELRGRPVPGAKPRVGKYNNPDYQIRPSVFIALEKKTEASLRHYVIPPVLKKLDDEIPLEYLNESRLTSICFIKVEVRPFDSGVSYVDAMSAIVQSAFKQIYKNGLIMGGCLTKIIMFDKGLTYLVVFGLPGYMHDNQSAHALKFSYKVKANLNCIKHVSEVSLGVTSGSTYCGVLGHTRRREYTVIGRKVNKAARLMCYYPGKVTCDQDTLYHSKLPVHHFSLMEAKVLKGIANVGNIYEYLSSESGEDQSVKKFEYPLIGREAEVGYFRAILEGTEIEFTRFLQSHRIQEVMYDLRATNKEVMAAGLWILCFEGDIGIGKSRVLSAGIQEAEERGIAIFSVTMNMMLGSQGIACIRGLLWQAFGMEDMRTAPEREEHLRRIIGDDQDLAAGLCLLDELLGVKFPMNPRYANAEMTSRHVISMHILNILIRHFYPESFLIFIVDDAHLMDSLCWDYLLSMSRSPAVCTIVAIRRNSAGAPKLPEAVTKILYHHKNVRTVRLTGMESKFALALACQMLEVSALPVELERILVQKSQGNPAWIEQVLSEMIRTGLIKILPFDLKEAARRNMKLLTVPIKIITRLVYATKRDVRAVNAWHSEEISLRNSEPDLGDNLFTSTGLGSTLNIAARRVQKAMIRPETRMCVVKSDTNISSAPIPGTLKEILLDAFDELNSNEQMLLKCASALGFRFCRAMLVRIVPLYEVNSRKYEFGLRHLMESRMIRCASVPGPGGGHGRDGGIQCYCRFTKEDFANTFRAKQTDSESVDVKEDETTDRPKYYNCKFMQFSKDNMVEVVYELMTADQRKEFHLKAGKYLDTSSIRCRICGGDDTAYTFGFTMKGGDIGADHEESLRTAATQVRRRSLVQGPKGTGGARRDTIDSMESDTGTTHQDSGRGNTASTTTRIDSLKKIIQSSGSKIGAIEMDILKAIDNFERVERDRTRSKCCRWMGKSGKEAETEEAREYDLEIKILNKMDVDREPGAAGSGGGDGGANISVAGTRPVGEHVERYSLGGDGDPALPPPPNQVVDFRGCGCANIQAKICLELVKHYRKAEKFGKCLINLLDASESAVAIGNSGQSLIHLEDAVALLRALNSNELEAPSPDDGDDIVVKEEEVNTQIEFLHGLTYFELGAQHKARDYFSRSLKRYGMEVPLDEEKAKRTKSIMKASSKLWHRHNCICCGPPKNKKDRVNFPGATAMKLRILSYLHVLFKTERKMEMALLISLWQVIVAEEISGSYHDVLSSYCNMMDMYSVVGEHKMAAAYEKLALKLIRKTFGSEESQNTMGIYTSANVFMAISSIRTLRGELSTAVDAAYLALRIANMMHDNALAIQVFPRLVASLLFTLRISEVIEALQKLWYTAEEEEDWGGVAIYYTLCLDLLLNTAYPMEPFYTCENFVTNSDWNNDVQVFRSYEVQYNMEASLALWHCRYSRFDGAQKWMTLAEAHRPKQTSFLSVGAELKLLECELIFVNHYLESKRYQHFAKARNSAKAYMRALQKATEAVPVFMPRFLHLMGYYCQIRSRKAQCERHLKLAETMAISQGNDLEMEWISHNRTVWMDVAIPTIKYFWLEHTENHTLDWHQCGKVPWANIMYSLPTSQWGR